MNTELFNRINGYLEGLSRINTYFGGCYGHEYLFSVVDQPIERAVIHYNKTSNLSTHQDIKYLPLISVEDWKKTLFELSADWFFLFYRMQNFQVKVAYFDDQGNQLPEEPAEYDRRSNSVSNRIIELIEQFIEDKDVKVFRLSTEVAEKDEFDWEQLYFVINNKVFVLEFYQWG
ncbi:hypothetical protein ACE6ED_18995 [Paenibacillus sp. CN-4]|uniref:hypothetical protein n=1 Tax=Paenibacillus nanchangensis TaxID=3348343 RepID=UPI0039783850